MTGAECPYLDTIARSALDFDFAASGCSVSLATANVYCCLVCGKFYAGKGRRPRRTRTRWTLGTTCSCGSMGGGGGGGEGEGERKTETGEGVCAASAFFFSFSIFHFSFFIFHCFFLFLRIRRTTPLISYPAKTFFQQEGYEVEDPCLDPIRAVLAPRFDKRRISALDSDRRWARSLDGEPFVPGIVGLNNLAGRTDFANAVLQSLARVGPLRDFFLDPLNYRHAASSLLVCRFGDFLRRVWNDRAFRGHVSPHELMVAVERASKGRFSPGGGGGSGGIGSKKGKNGAAALGLDRRGRFLVWLSTRSTSTSWSLPAPRRPGARRPRGSRPGPVDCHGVLPGGGGGDDRDRDRRRRSGGGGGEPKRGRRETRRRRQEVKVPGARARPSPRSPLPGRAGAKHHPAGRAGHSPAKYDGRTVTDDAKAGRRTLKITRLPRFLLLHVRRFARNAFFAEKNPTIVNFPVKGLPLGELLRYKSSSSKQQDDADPFRYDLAANVAHEGPAAAGVFKAHVQRKSDGSWFECCDLRVAETLPQVVALSEAYVQVWEKRPVVIGLRQQQLLLLEEEEQCRWRRRVEKRGKSFKTMFFCFAKKKKKKKTK